MKTYVVGAQWNRLEEAILMSTHNIGFYEVKVILMSTHNIGFYDEISKIITYHQISSNTYLISSAIQVRASLLIYRRYRKVPKF